jgi:RNA polymerase primary sigma factor
MTATKEKKAKTERFKSDESVLSMNFKEISRIPLLTREEEEEAARAAKKRNIAARNKLINGHLRFVVNVAKKYQGQGLPLADLISEGNIGLINAIEKFDVDRGYHFISYAVWWIRQSIAKAIYEKSRFIRLPANRTNDLIQIKRAAKMLFNQNNTENEIQEIARLLNIKEDYVTEMMTISSEVLSLEEMVGTDKETTPLGKFVVDSRYEAPEQEVLKKSLENDIEEMLDTLDSKEAEIIRLRFGLGKRIPMSLQEIGTRFNLTKERIRQIEEKALLHLRRKTKLEDYVVA